MSRDLLNGSIGLQNTITAFTQLRDAVVGGVELAKRVDELKKEVTQLEHEIEAKQKQGKNLETKSAELAPGYKPQMLERREKAVSARELVARKRIHGGKKGPGRSPAIYSRSAGMTHRRTACQTLTFDEAKAIINHDDSRSDRSYNHYDQGLVDAVNGAFQREYSRHASGCRHAPAV